MAQTTNIPAVPTRTSFFRKLLAGEFTPDGVGNWRLSRTWILFFEQLLSYITAAVGTQPYVACEIPKGKIDGTNTVFTVSRTILTAPMPILELSGAVQDPLNANPTPDYTVSGKTITYKSAPEVGSRHVIWYWYNYPAPGALTTTTGKARKFGAALTDSVDWGGSATYNIHGDLSAGMWVYLPGNASGYLMFRGNGNFLSGPAPGGNECIRIIVAGSSSPFNITISWEFGSSPTQQSNTFAAAIPANTWTYIGISRDSTAKTVTFYKGDGTTITTIGTWTYATNPDGGTGDCHLVVGNQYPINQGTGGVCTIQEHYLWTRVLSDAEHGAAMQGTPSQTGIVLECSMGNTPEVDNSPTGSTGAVTGTSLVTGHD